VRITRVGNALAAIIPKALAERMKIKKGDLVEIQIKKRIPSGKGIIRRRITFEEEDRLDVRL